jgi:hypothetical protein
MSREVGVWQEDEEYLGNVVQHDWTKQMRKLLIYGSMEELFLTDVLKYTQITCLETKGERDTIKKIIKSMKCIWDLIFGWQIAWISDEKKRQVPLAWLYDHNSRWIHVMS